VGTICGLNLRYFHRSPYSFHIYAFSLHIPPWRVNGGGRSSSDTPFICVRDFQLALYISTSGTNSLLYLLLPFLSARIPNGLYSFTDFFTKDLNLQMGSLSVWLAGDAQFCDPPPPFPFFGYPYFDLPLAFSPPPLGRPPCCWTTLCTFVLNKNLFRPAAFAGDHSPYMCCEFFCWTTRFSKQVTAVISFPPFFASAHRDLSMDKADWSFLLQLRNSCKTM